MPTPVRPRHGPAGPVAQNLLVSAFPFALMLGIFYVLVLMPMRKRQKKVQEFQAALKVGDKVITTGGIYGQVTQAAKTQSVQIADRRQGPDRSRPRRDRRLSGAGAGRPARIGRVSSPCTRTFAGSSR